MLIIEIKHGNVLTKLLTINSIICESISIVFIKFMEIYTLYVESQKIMILCESMQ